MQSRGHKSWPLNAWADHIRASRQSYGAAAGFLITLQLRFHRNGLFKALQICSSADVKFETHASSFQPLSVHSLVCLSVCLSIASPSALSLKRWNCAENMASRQERERKSERACKASGTGREGGGRGREGGPTGFIRLRTERPPPSLLSGAAARRLVAPPCSLRPPSPPPPPRQPWEEDYNPGVLLLLQASLPLSVCTAVWKPLLHTHTQTSSHARYILRAFEVATRFT